MFQPIILHTCAIVIWPDQILPLFDLNDNKDHFFIHVFCLAFQTHRTFLDILFQTGVLQTFLPNIGTPYCGLETWFLKTCGIIFHG